jgi:hypothetical protein
MITFGGALSTLLQAWQSGCGRKELRLYLGLLYNVRATAPAECDRGQLSGIHGKIRLAHMQEAGAKGQVPSGDIEDLRGLGGHPGLSRVVHRHL